MTETQPARLCRVLIVEAGLDDPVLLFVKAVRSFRRADVVLYERLVV
jgi:siroheme synthase